ncbi:hypothetical protein HMPREF0299_5065 [Corynebacterium matruchotii ATCC 14266]|uniref:Uncharacterized protein n=1 Tax=Corynebacterium matruchotii ATCC 14266 TaxID=553207 RepID=E0DHB3_9CORY|nr:hypothetical protein HMPREF0299_5065 [Corynebacterium matruchotii ATCC 14266]
MHPTPDNPERRKPYSGPQPRQINKATHNGPILLAILGVV